MYTGGLRSLANNSSFTGNTGILCVMYASISGSEHRGIGFMLVDFGPVGDDLVLLGWLGRRDLQVAVAIGSVAIARASEA